LLIASVPELRVGWLEESIDEIDKLALKRDQGFIN